MSEAPYRPLLGVRVVDLTRLVVGALATRQLADMGAEVVKIEDPTSGDYLRSIPPLVDGQSVLHWLLNRNKKSVALDIREGADRTTLEGLIGRSDVVVELSRPGSMKRLGIDLAELRTRFPRLVVCSISGFGQTGEWSMLPAHGMNLENLAGTSLVTDADGESRFVEPAFTTFANEQGAMNAAVAILAALWGARESGQGAWLDISCWDGAVEVNRGAIAYQAATGRSIREVTDAMWGSKHRLYEARGGELVFVALIEQKFWRSFCDHVGRPDLGDRWDGGADVDYGAEDLRPVLAEIFATRTAAEWAASFVEWGLPGSPVLELADVLSQPHFESRGMLERSPDWPVPNVMSAVRLVDHGGVRIGSAPDAPPRIGEHTAEILDTWLGAADERSGLHRGP